MDEYKVYLVGNKHCCICLKTQDEARLLSNNNAAEFFKVLQMLQSTPWICVWCSSKLRHFQDLQRRARRSEDLLNALRYNVEHVKGNKPYYQDVLEKIKMETFTPLVARATTVCAPSPSPSTTNISIEDLPSQRTTEPTQLTNQLGQNTSFHNVKIDFTSNEIFVKSEPSPKAEPDDDLESDEVCFKFTKSSDEPVVCFETENSDKQKTEDPLNDVEVSRATVGDASVMSVSDARIGPYNVGKVINTVMYNSLCKPNKTGILPPPLVSMVPRNLCVDNVKNSSIPGYMPAHAAPGYISVQAAPGYMVSQAAPAYMPVQIAPGYTPVQAASGYIMPAQTAPVYMPVQTAPGCMPAQAARVYMQVQIAPGYTPVQAAPGYMPVQPIRPDENILSLRRLIKEGKEIILNERHIIRHIFDDFIKSNVRSVRMTEAQEKHYYEELTKSVRHKNKPFKCELCAMGFASEHAYKEHLRKHTTESGNYVCKTCKLYHKTEDALRSHTVSQHYVHSCTSCSRGFRDVRYVLNHAVLAHSSITIRCEHCDKRFQSPIQFQKHVVMHNDSGDEAKCALCVKTFHRSVDNRKELFNEHIRTHKEHGEVVECKECKKTVPRNNLKSHIAQKHARTSTCALCNKSYASSYLEKHMQRSHNKRMYECDDCGKDYVNKTELTRHITWIHLKIGHKCKKCRRLFQSSGQLQLHINSVHRKIPLAKNILCDICGKAFSARHILKNHRLIHSGARPHACEHCGKTFRQRTTMCTHIKLVHERMRYSDLVAARKASRAAKKIK